MRTEWDKETIEELCSFVLTDCEHRFQAFPIDLFEPALYEVACGLLARQASLALDLVCAPSIWNQHSAPLFHRAMSDVHISLSYILEDESSRRASDFILYGLGQEKLSLAHLESSYSTESDTNLKPLIEAKRDWLNCQRLEFLTTVNVGSAMGRSTREMAEICGLKDLYDFNFSPFSASVHSTWQHIGRFNLEPCANPLHGQHLLPKIEPLPCSWNEPFVALKTLRLSLKVIDDFSGPSLEDPPCLAWDYLVERLRAKRDPTSD